MSSLFHDNISFKGSHENKIDSILEEREMLKNIFALVVMTLLLLVGTAELFAQEYPNRAINLVIPMASGDSLDVIGRIMADKLSKVLGVPIITLNKPGGGATVGTDMVAKAKKDGYTIILTHSAPMVNAKVLEPETVSYDPFKDFTPLGLTHYVPMIIVVRSDASYKNFKELLEYGKKNPGKIRCGTAGVKSTGDFNAELFKTLTLTELTVIPFKGASPGVTALLGGHIDILSVSFPVLITYLRSGDMKGIVISNSSPEFPEIPTFKQLGYKQNLFDVWNAFFAPAGFQSKQLKPWFRPLRRWSKILTFIPKWSIWVCTENMAPRKSF